MIGFLLACRFFSTPVTSTPQSVIGVDKLLFADADTGDRFRALDGCIKKLVDDTWKTTSYQLVGNFYMSDWCNGAGSPTDCQIAYSTIDNRDQHIISLDTLFYSQDYPQVFGLGMQAMWVPKTTGWGASFYFAEKGKTIVGEGWGVNFRQYLTPGGPVDATVDIGWKYQYTIHGPNETSFEQSSDLPLREDLARYLSSAETMRDLALEQIQALAVKVEGEISGHRVKACDLGPYLGKGIPPACTLRPMTASEEATELGKARATFTHEEQLLHEQYQEMYAVWMTAFPLDQCWP